MYELLEYFTAEYLQLSLTIIRDSTFYFFIYLFSYVQYKYCNTLSNCYKHKEKKNIYIYIFIGTRK